MTPGAARRYPAPVRFSRRRMTAPEFLDDPSLPADERAASYRDLERFESWPFQYGPLERGVRGLLGPGRGGAIDLLELGAGTGHTGRRLAAALGRDGFTVRLHLTDREPAFLRRTPGVQISRIDWREDPLPETDIVVANLVLHHFETEAAVEALRRAAGSARIGGVIYDLDRNPLVFHALRLFLPLVVESPITRADALISVQQAFTAGELESMARAAGMAAPRVSTHGLARNRLVWATDGASS